LDFAPPAEDLDCDHLPGANLPVNPLTFSVPQFFFHVTTAYDILRHCGVDLVKKDFLGTPDRASHDCKN
jgi:hypothetical protein